VRTDSVEKLVEIGVVGKPHGIDGRVRIFLHNSDSAVITSIPTLFLDQSGELNEVVVLSLRPGNRCHLAQFEGITSRTEAEVLTGAKIVVPRSLLPPVEEDEFYIADLIGLKAVVGDALLGRVASSRPQGGIEVVRIESETEEIEIPLVADFVAVLDIDGGVVVFKDIDELPRYPLEKRAKK
jgi:16S rRNA processing protein RimM